MGHIILIISILGILLSFPVKYSFAEEQNEKKEEEVNYWLNAGYGVVGTFNSYRDIIGISLSAQTKRSLFSIRYIRVQETLSVAGPKLEIHPSEIVWDLGLLYGVCEKGSSAFGAVAAGLAAVGGQNRGKYLYSIGGGCTDHNNDYYETLGYLTVGIPVEAQLMWTPFPFVGAGLWGFADLNPKKSFGGLLLTIQIGKLNPLW